jgi:hypothetical protein
MPVRGGRTTARLLGDLWDAEGADARRVRPAEGAERDPGGLPRKTRTPSSMTGGSAPCSLRERSGLGDPWQPEGRLEEMAPGALGPPAPPFFQGPPCVPLCSPCLRGKKDRASSAGQTLPVHPPNRTCSRSAAVLVRRDRRPLVRSPDGLLQPIGRRRILTRVSSTVTTAPASRSSLVDPSTRMMTRES